MSKLNSFYDIKSIECVAIKYTVHSTETQTLVRFHIPGEYQSPSQFSFVF